MTDTLREQIDERLSADGVHLSENQIADIIALVQGAEGEVQDEYTTDFATLNGTLYTFPVRVTVRAVPLPQPEDVAGILKGELGSQSSGDCVRENWQEGDEG